DWLLKQNESFVIVQGIRAEESSARAKMEKECDYFKYYKQPYGYDKKNKPKYYTYRKKDVLKRSEQYATDIIRPFFNHTGSEVMRYIIDAGLKPNPLYYMGFNRVGCFPCIMCNKSE